LLIQYAMKHHPTSPPRRTRLEDLDRGTGGIRRRPQPRRRRHTIRPRDALNDIAHTARRSGAPGVTPGHRTADAL
jgi:hypothetical protein